MDTGFICCNSPGYKGLPYLARTLDHPRSWTMHEVGSSKSHSRTQNGRKDISSELLARFEIEGEAFLSRTVTANETWTHHFELGIKSSRTRNGTNRTYTHLFLVGARL
jgi:hypothetical protein